MPSQVWPYTLPAHMSLIPWSVWDLAFMGGPVRYIGVMKPIHLYYEMEAWCVVQDIPKPSFTTLLRALDQSRCVRFRKTAGQHPNCDKCMEYKQRLRALQHPEQRALVLEEYLPAYIPAMVRPGHGCELH